MILRAIVGSLCLGMGLYQFVMRLGLQFLVWHLSRESLEMRDLLAKYVPLWAWVLVDLGVSWLPGVGVGPFLEVLDLGVVVTLSLVKLIGIGWEWREAIHVILQQSF